LEHLKLNPYFPIFWFINFECHIHNHI
jgi:hypothetical protein